MAQLSAAQLNLIGNEFLSIAQTIGDYRYDNFSTLSDNDKQQLSDLHQELLSYADDLALTSAMTNVSDAQTALSQIQDVTMSINRDVSHLTEVKTVINIAGAVVALAATIVTGGVSAAAIAAGLGAAVAAVEAIKK